MTTRLAVIGCGLIGESWAALGLARGWDVSAWDPAEKSRASLPERIIRPLTHLNELHGWPISTAKLRVTQTLEEAVEGAILIQENAPEQVPLKQALYADIEAAADARAIIASSTSALTWSSLSGTLKVPERFITAHPFNPPHLIPLVEIYGVDEDILSRAEALYRELGRSPVRLKKEAVGHIANRLASALWREAVNIVAEGIADVADIDTAMRDGPGLRWSVTGAHMAYHLGGGPGGIRHYLAHLGPSQVKRWQSLGTPELTPELCERLIDGIEHQAAGRTIPELENERDRLLIQLQKARQSGSNDHG
ncbi:3-hydroxyacyl-CoA dehydrogenase NAD-binding domain-containing protein [Rhizobium sp. AG855]|uniref:3-hydroxyacyl-CoA dehydrogenase NAD-binding domain-containing protein n=1 Tax=Rhizobium sp. AG855 TaxID=2183898 RepID=UPI000E768402|nr:3-hydroxyacyl-CoA dehydrogenase NAD-binding domain-containing protein [Rhizobium sp. AG855]RKE83341.1 3-hydroxyacyl-CoA dehydrogenase [Rhizobium sp. AG855]